MKTAIQFCLLLAFVPSVLFAQDWGKDLLALVEDSCLHCHDESTTTGLDFTDLSRDLDDSKAFEKWVRIHDRIANGEMPPKTEERPDAKLVERTVAELSDTLTAKRREIQKSNGRAQLRRVTRTEFQFMVQDLLQIDTPIAELIPEENNSSGFDTVAAGQGISALHVESYLLAIDRALETTIELKPRPEARTKRFEFKESPLVRNHLEMKNGDKVIIRELDDAVVMFADAPYLFKLEDFYPERRGRYRISAEVFPFQTERPVVFAMMAGDYKRGRVRYLDYWDLTEKESKTFEIFTTLNGGEYLFPAPHDLYYQENGKNVWGPPVDEYKGSGIAIKWMEVEGPLNKHWPPKYTTELLEGVEIRELESPKWVRDHHVQYELVAGENPRKQLEQIVAKIAPRAFRRPLRDAEGTPFVDLGMKAFEEGQSFETAIRVTLRSVLTAPQFLFYETQSETLDDWQLAARLAAFLWKSIPDDELYRLAAKGKLSNWETLSEQTERMLKDSRSNRFVEDFCGQWLQLDDLNATSPDTNLYPEYDELLNDAMLKETHEFFTALLNENLSTDNFIDSDFTFLNRRMAEHYGIDGVDGQEIKKVELPADSLRGGLMTHASVLKVTANGTVTSPVRRGSWVLTHLLGEAPSPPPPNIGSIEPDTRGTTTIRESLDKHRNTAACESCHREIDPPGFALESFDVIGGFRENYRSVENGEYPPRKLQGRAIWEYRDALPVDASGQTSEGEKFEDVSQFKALLMKRREQVARNFVSLVSVYATGAEIDFADRAVVEQVLNKVRDDDFGVRSIVHEVIQSSLFKSK